MSNMLNQWLIIITSASLFIFCDYLSTTWARNNNLNSIIMVFVLGPLAYILFGLLTRLKSVSVSSGIVNMFLLIGSILVGVLVFKDELATKQIVGLVFAVIAVALMN